MRTKSIDKPCVDCNENPRRSGSSYCKSCLAKRTRQYQKKSSLKSKLCFVCGKAPRMKNCSYCAECKKIKRRQYTEVEKEQMPVPEDVINQQIRRIEYETMLLNTNGHCLDEMSAYEADRYLCELSR